MGCDIHMFAEVKKSGKWEMVRDEVFDVEYSETGKTIHPYDGRNYTLFSFLADVRNGYPGSESGDRIEPIMETRGIPEDASAYFLEISRRWEDDGHSFHWLTLEELKNANWDQKIIKRGVVTSDKYDELKRTGENPEGWFKAIGGGSIEVLSETDWNNLKEKLPNIRYYVRMQWEDTLRECCGNFIEQTIPRLETLGAPTDVRIVFFFDN